MDPLTHALSGALLVRASQSPTTLNDATGQTRLPLRLQIIAGFAAAAFPDMDVILRLIDTLTYLNWHQGPTHSLLLLPLWAWMLSWIGARLTRGRHAWPLFMLPVTLGLAAHIAGDVITSYGLMLYAPFSTERFALPLIFVIDPWFSLIIMTGLVASYCFPQSRIPAIVALIILCGYVIVLSTLRQQAIELARDHASRHDVAEPSIQVLPQPLSPFHWKLIVLHDETYYLANANLSPFAVKPVTAAHAWLVPKMAAAYQPITAISWSTRHQFGNDPEHAALIREAWQVPALKSFRSFAQLPVLENMDHSVQSTCAWFYDLRFQFPELPPSFRYGACRKHDQADWRLVRKRGLFYMD